MIFRFHIVELWMATIERSLADVQNTDLPLEQYKQFVNKFKVRFTCLSLTSIRMLLF